MDRIIGNEEIVVKPLEKNFRTITGFTGAALLGDGTITLVVDVPGLLQTIKNEQQLKSAKTGKVAVGGRNIIGQIRKSKSMRIIAICQCCCNPS